MRAPWLSIFTQNAHSSFDTQTQTCTCVCSTYVRVTPTTRQRCVATDDENLFALQAIPDSLRWSISATPPLRQHTLCARGPPIIAAARAWKCMLLGDIKYNNVFVIYCAFDERSIGTFRAWDAHSRPRELDYDYRRSHLSRGARTYII